MIGQPLSTPACPDLRPARPTRRRPRAVIAVVVATLLAAGVVVTTTPAAEARVPAPAHRYTAKIEQLASYVPQRKCSPRAKKGTVAFSRLLLRTYPRSHSLGISRACRIGGISEHKEGRAFDWAANAHRKRDRRMVRTLITWLFKTDRFGNEYAMARRLGIQYVIWNRKIWGAYSADRGWRRYTGSNPHTDHVHFSLSWAGARRRTSFWNPNDFPNGTPPTPPPTDPTDPWEPTEPTDPWEPTEPDPTGPEPSYPDPGTPPPGAEQLAVDSRSEEPVRTAASYPAGTRLRVSVAGTYLMRAADDWIAADAECTATWEDRRWRSQRYSGWFDGAQQPLGDLVVDGRILTWAPSGGWGECSWEDHAYTLDYTVPADGRVSLVIADDDRSDNRGSLSVTVAPR